MNKPRLEISTKVLWFFLSRKNCFFECFCPALTGLLLAFSVSPAFASATRTSAGTALSQAESGAAQAAAAHDQWTPTIAALAAARAAYKTGDYAKAQALAARASKLAAASVEQAREQKQLWRNEAVR